MSVGTKRTFIARRSPEQPDSAAAPVFRADLAPTLNTGFAPAFFEDEALRSIISSAQFADSDSPSLAGGSLVVTLAEVTANDRLALVTTGPDIGLSGNTVTWQGNAIGTLSGGGFGGASLTVTFSAGATPAAVQALIRAVGYESTEQGGPSNRLLMFNFTVTDDTGGAVQAAVNVTRMGSDDAPAVNNLGGDIAAAIGGGAAVRLDQGTAVTVTDVDNVNFNMGSLTVRMTQNRVNGEDLFGIAANSGVSIAAGIVTVNGVNIGTANAFGVGQDMIISFNSGATPTLVAQLMGAVTYTNTNGFTPSTLTREVSFILNDGGFIFGTGTNTATVITQINVTAPSGPPPPPPPPSGVPEGPRMSTIASFGSQDMVLSGDGLRLYTAGYDGQAQGFVRIYNAETGALIQEIRLGVNPGRLDVSLDGRYLFVTESVAANPQTYELHRVDLQTGVVNTYVNQLTGNTTRPGDVACLENGLVLLDNGKLLDPATGVLTDVGVSLGELERAADGRQVLVEYANSTPGFLYDVSQGVRFRDTSDYVFAGRSAAHSVTGLTAVVGGGAGINIYDSQMDFLIRLTQYEPQFNSLEGVAFDETGAYLFVLDFMGDQVVQLSTADWSIVHAIPLELDFSPTGGNSDLNVAPDMRYFTFMGTGGIRRVNNPFVSDAVQGTFGNDILVGTAVDDYLIGDTGADQMTGGAGNDIYYVDQNGDVVVEGVGGGSDTVRAGASYVLGAGAEVERLETASRYGTAALSLTGNEFANTIVGNAGNNVLIGEGGSDTLIGGRGNDVYRVEQAGDTVIEAVGGGTDSIYTLVSYALAAGSEVELLSAIDPNATDALVLTGNEFANFVIGNRGSNTLIGGAGPDTLIGGGGNDFYRVEDSDDKVSEGLGGGIDSVYAVGNYILAAGAEVELLSAIDPNNTVSMTLVGNEFDNFVIGNNGVNTLIGGAGSDTLIGNGGNDFYRVEDSNDKITEAVGGGFDSAYAVGNYTLAAGAEVEVLSAIDPANLVAMTLIGNEFDNFIIGNNGSNTLIGGSGSDTLIGNGGDDFYRVEDSGDKITETAGGGFDSAYAVGNYTLQAGAEVELLSAIDPANSVAMNLTGNAFANRIYGNNGANVLTGGGGLDLYTGGGGADTFVLGAAPGAGNVVAIADMATGVDKLALDDAVFAGIGSPGSFNAAAFVVGTTAADADDRLVYNSGTGQLFYDADGIGGAAGVLIATLTGNPALAASDFMVI